MPEAYIVATARTSGGGKGGRLKEWHSANLSAQIINALPDCSGTDPVYSDDVIWGCVQQVGEQAGNIGRNAVPATSVDRQCGSSQPPQPARSATVPPA